MSEATAIDNETMTDDEAELTQILQAYQASELYHNRRDSDILDLVLRLQNIIAVYEREKTGHIVEIQNLKQKVDYYLQIASSQEYEKRQIQDQVARLLSKQKIK